MNEYDPRRAEPGQAFTWNDAWGVKHDFKADGKGVVRPRNAAEVECCDAFDLPVARKVIREEEAAAKADQQPVAPATGGSD